MINNVGMRGSDLCVFFPPSIHFGVSLAFWIGHVDAGWQYLLMADFPFSGIMAGLMFRGVNDLIVFGILGTLWWYFVSLMIRRLFTR